LEGNVTLESQALDLKVLIEYDACYETYFARCLETGALATGVTPEDASRQIKSTLELDIRCADEQGGLASLFHVRAEPEVWDRWYQAKAAAKPEVVTLNIPPLPTARRLVRSVTIATARKTA
jgi:hypothetical protein